MPSPDESDLKVLFDALRNEERPHTRPYSRARWPGHGRTMRVRLRLTFAGALILLIAATIVIVNLPSDTPPAAAPIPIAEWKAPTDFLLLTPGHDLMQSVPRFGDVKGVSR